MPVVPRPPGARPGRPAPWADLDEASLTGISLERVKRGLGSARLAGPEEPVPGQEEAICQGGAGRPAAQSTPLTVAEGELPELGGPRPAGVLCALFEQDGEANVVLTRRALSLRDHAGEVSFPGGRLEPGETALEAALREAHEEVGLGPASVTVLGELTPLTTRRSTALVRCFVASFAGPHAQPGGLVASAEVDKVFWVPLCALAAPGAFHEELWPAPGAGAGPSAHAVPFFALAEDTVWGATGRLLAELLSLALGAAVHDPPWQGTLG